MTPRRASVEPDQHEVPAAQPAPALPPPVKVPERAETSCQQAADGRRRGSPDRTGAAPGQEAAPVREGGKAPAGGARAPLAGSSKIAAAMSEDKGRDSLDAHVRRLMKDLGLMRYHTLRSIGSESGYPDWTIAGPGGVLFRELKRQGKDPAAAQQAWFDVLSAAGQDADVWRPEDLLSGRIARELAAIAGLRGAA